MPKEDTQFKKGQSGNPDGRPAGSRGFTTIFNEVLEEIEKANSIPKGEALKILLKKAYGEAKDGNHQFYQDLMNRNFGKPQEHVDLTTAGEAMQSLSAEAIKEAEAILKAKKTNG